MGWILRVGARRIHPDRAPRPARCRCAGPTVAPQHDSHLSGDIARPAADIRRSITQHIHAPGHPRVVPAMITPTQVRRMRSLTIQLHQRGVLPIADIVIPATTVARTHLLTYPAGRACRRSTSRRYRNSSNDWQPAPTSVSASTTSARHRRRPRAANAVTNRCTVVSRCAQARTIQPIARSRSAECSTRSRPSRMPRPARRGVVRLRRRGRGSHRRCVRVAGSRCRPASTRPGSNHPSATNCDPLTGSVIHISPSA